MNEVQANKHRGEVTISLGGRSYLLRPTFAAIAEIEARSGQGLIGLARRLAAGRRQSDRLFKRALDPLVHVHGQPPCHAA